MDFNLQPDSHSTNRANERPPNYFSASVKLRLATLVAALGLVFLAMNEAGKPATWERLGFADSNEQSEQPAEANAGVIQVTEHLPRRQSSEDVSSTLQKFWGQQILKFDKIEKQKLSDRLRSLQSGGSESFEGSLGGGIERGLEQFLQEARDVDPDSIEMVERSVRSIVGKSSSHSDADLQQVRSVLDRHAYSLVEDRSSMNRSVESLAWNRTWENVFDQGNVAEFEPVSYLQLSGQPGAYRGKPIRVTGIVRGAQTLPLPDEHKLGLNAYQVLWVKPVGSNRTPFCIYAAKLPDGFPNPGDQFLTLDEEVVVDGYFFKLRSYEATNNQVEICPLIVADKVVWNQKTDQVAGATPSWEPPRWLLVLFFVGMPVLAGVMALSVYRSTRSLRRSYSEVAEEVESNLGQLVNDQSVMSDRERMAEFSRSIDRTDREIS